MATHSRTLAWKIPWTEEPGRLKSMGSLRVGHDWATSLSLFTFMHWRRKWQPDLVFLPGESQGRGAWWAAIYGVTQSRKRLKWQQQQQLLKILLQYNNTFSQTKFSSAWTYQVRGICRLNKKMWAKQTVFGLFPLSLLNNQLKYHFGYNPYKISLNPNNSKWNSYKI